MVRTMLIAALVVLCLVVLEALLPDGAKNGNRS